MKDRLAVSHIVKVMPYHNHLLSKAWVTWPWLQGQPHSHHQGVVLSPTWTFQVVLKNESFKNKTLMPGPTSSNSSLISWVLTLYWALASIYFQSRTASYTVICVLVCLWFMLLCEHLQDAQWKKVALLQRQEVFLQKATSELFLKEEFTSRQGRGRILQARRRV